MMTVPVKIRSMIQARREIPFYNQIDLLTVEEDIIIGASGNLTIGFRVEGFPLMLKSNQEIAAAVDSLRKVLGHLPEKTQYQFILKKKPGAGKVLYAYRNALAVNTPLSREFLEDKTGALKKDRLFHQDLYLFITRFNPEKQKFSDTLKVIGNQTRILSEAAVTQKKEELLAAKSYLENAFGNLRIKLVPMTEKEYKSFFYFHLNPNRAPRIRLGEAAEKPAGEITLRSSLLFASPIVEYEYFYQDGFYYQGVNLLLPPDSTDIRALNAMLDKLSFPYDFSLSIYVPNNDEEIEKLKTRANITKTFGLSGSAKNYDALEKYSEIDSLITEVKSSSQKLAYYSFAFLVKDRTFAGVKKKQSQILEVFSSLGSSEGIADHMNHDRLYLSFLPGQGWMNPRRHLIQSDALANILPIQSDWQGTDRARVLLKTRKNQLLKLDLFDDSLPARHGIVLGATGAGKSFTTNYLLLNYLLERKDNRLVIIDVGNSYKRLCSILGGAYFDIDLGENYSFNPLLSRSQLFQNNEVNAESLAYLALVVEKLVKGRPDEILTNAEKRIIEKAILKTYREQESPLLGDLLLTFSRYSEGDEADRKRAYDFSKNLAVWTDGRYGKLLNRKGNINTSNPFIVFELGKLDAYPDLQSVIFFIIRSAIWDKLYQRETQKVIVIDEGWRFFNDETSSKLIEDLYRTARKFNGLILSISQSPEDFLGTRAANAIISNSFTRYVLKLNKNHELLAQFGLNDSEINEAKSLISKPGEFSEAFVKYGSHSVTARIEPTPLEYWMATTDPADCNMEAKLREKTPNISCLELLKQLAREYPKGTRQGGSN
jgi:type IV secretory pathway VirB4 component